MAERDLASRVVFRQGEWVAVDKPAGWLSVPSRFEKNDPRPVLGRLLEKHLRARLFPIHRLDQEVGGLVLFASSEEAQRRANRWFETRAVQKTYQALSGERDFSHWPADLRRADGDVPENEDHEWRCRILRGKRRSYEHPKGDPSVTIARRLPRDADGRLRWLLRPQTGRPHQLRFEMSRHGFPIVGDKLYGSGAAWDDGIALRAVRLDFSEIPDDERRGLPAALETKGLFE